MLKFILNLFQGQSSSESARPSQNEDVLRKLSKLTAAFAYNYSFAELPRTFFSDPVKFLQETKRPTSIGKWTQHQLDSDLVAHIIEFPQHQEGEVMNKSLMAAAVYNVAAETPLQFYVLIDSPMGVRVREVNSELASWAIRSGLNPVAFNSDVGSFVEFLKSTTQQSSN
jgi:hypothetical protein